MDVNQMLTDLRAELAAVDQAIAAVARIAQSQRKPRGRPPAWLASKNGPVPVKRERGRPPKS